MISQEFHRRLKRAWFFSTQYFEKNRNYLLITGFVTTTTRRVPHVEQELLTQKIGKPSNFGSNKTKEYK
jgi:hypothetical protein